MWKSPKQPQVPRSTAEPECTAMAHSSQYLEGIVCLFRAARIGIAVPVLVRATRLACRLPAGSRVQQQGHLREELFEVVGEGHCEEAEADGGHREGECLEVQLQQRLHIAAGEGGC